MNRWQQTGAFANVVEHQSFSAAADAMGMSKAHISRKVSQLENRLGRRIDYLLCRA